VIRAPDPAGEPELLASAIADEARSLAEAFFARVGKERQQETFTFDASIYDAEDVRGRLFEVFRGKCAYCESPLTAGDFVVDHLRPMNGALALDGTASPDHYWWLAYAWENLYACDADCASFKGARFRKGATSIDVYALLRDGLVRARKARQKLIRKEIAVARGLAQALDQVGSNGGLEQLLRESLAMLRDYMNPDAPYSAMARQMIEPVLAELTG
jgi:hypothetical protein